jgi:hypothetical protein
VTLPPAFRSTRDSLHALACYAIAPARKARTGRIGLRPTGDGFGTPPFEDGSRTVVRGDRLQVEPGDGIAITTVRAAAEFLGVALRADPGVGSDLPPFEPDALLAIDIESSIALGRWYWTGHQALAALGIRVGESMAAISEAQLWPEHFDLAVTADLSSGRKINVGFSAGDSFEPDPYVYVGPHDMTGVEGDYWNAPFGAYERYEALASDDQTASALAFIEAGIASL